VRVARNAFSTWTLYTSTLPTANGGGHAATTIPSATNPTLIKGLRPTVLTLILTTVILFRVCGQTTSIEPERVLTNSTSIPPATPHFRSNSQPLQPTPPKAELNDNGERNLKPTMLDFGSTAVPSETANLNVSIRSWLMVLGQQRWHKTYTFTNNDVEDGISYFYYLEDVAFDGTRNKSLVIQAGLRSDLARKHLTRWATLKQ